MMLLMVLESERDNQIEGYDSYLVGIVDGLVDQIIVLTPISYLM
jgi:hypothetical protein